MRVLIESAPSAPVLAAYRELLAEALGDDADALESGNRDDPHSEAQGEWKGDVKDDESTEV
ncbi:MAG: hypothetical protein FJ312_10610 [SAR202 cluster bacterium]|nr:hypothetical protein [SAR202 cluster bacterium]